MCVNPEEYGWRVPIQLWSEQNIKKIAENWGDVVFVEKDTTMKTSFASARVVIDTLCLSPIEDEAILQDGTKGFRISVFEAKLNSQSFTLVHWMKKTRHPPRNLRRRRIGEPMVSWQLKLTWSKERGGKC